MHHIGPGNEYGSSRMTGNIDPNKTMANDVNERRGEPLGPG